MSRSKTRANSGQLPGWALKIFFGFLVTGTLLVVGAVGAVLWHFSRGLPDIITVEDYRPLTVTRVLGGGGREDQLLGEFFRERRHLIPYDKLPEVIVRAFISAEDDTFFEHPGFNVASMIRAGIANFRAGHVVQGGSTITQQVAKSLLLTPERSFVRKIKEIILSDRIEKNLSKQQILYLYLNQIYLGHGAYGAQAAANTYFRKDIAEVSLAEAALLAGLPQAPSKYSPLVNPKRAKERQLYVLKRMADNRYITAVQMADAAAQPVRIYYDDELNKRYAAYFVEHIRRYLVEKYGEKAVYDGGLTVAVPATRGLAEAARKSLRDGLAAVDKRGGYRGPIRRIKGNDDIEKFLMEQRLKIIERKIGYWMFLPDGRADAIGSIKDAGFRGDVDLLDQGKSYQAVVSGFDEKRKTATVMIGALRAELPIDGMRWARLPKDEKNPQALRAEPKTPSTVLSRGDVILVSVAEKTPAGNVVVSLDQEPQVQGALFSLEAETGNVLAMEGGYDFDVSEFNRAIQAQRQPGSAFKPIIYSAGLEKGFTPASIIVDSPVVYEDSQTGKWKPGNFEEKFYGDTTFRQALIKSRNVPTIKIVQSIQVSYLIEYAKRLGLGGQFNADLSLALGSGAVSLMDLIRAYALFPRLGRRVDPVFITRITDRDGRVLEEHKPTSLPLEPKISTVMPAVTVVPATAGALGRSTITLPVYPPPEDPEQVLDPRVAYVMTHLMKEVVTHGTGQQARNLGRPAAGKTGTTNDYIDAWFIGFTPNVVSGAWVGFDSQRSMGPGETGAKAALPIWLGFMKQAVKGYPETDFRIPPGVVFASINPINGKLAAANSSSAIREAFIEGAQPVEMSDSGPGSPGAEAEFFKEDIQ